MAALWDKYYEVMPAREMPSIYPPARNGCFVRRGSCFPAPRRSGSLRHGGCAGAVAAGVDVPPGARPHFRVAVYAWNPLVIVEFAGSGQQRCAGDLGIVCGLALVKNCKVLRMCR